MAQKLIGFGVDAIGAMDTLRATNEPAANVVAYAALKSLLDKADLPDPDLSVERDIFNLAQTSDAAVLARAINENEFDLTTIDNGTGKTILHLAILAGKDEIVKMLIARAGNDPRILDAKDRGDIPH